MPDVAFFLVCPGLAKERTRDLLFFRLFSTILLLSHTGSPFFSKLWLLYVMLGAGLLNVA
jgi:hypothetical protein